MKRSIAILFFLILVTATGFSQCGLTPFTLLAPSAAEVTATSVQLNWGSAAGGTCVFSPTGLSVSYFVEYKLASTAIWQMGPNPPCATRTANVGGLTPGELYHFRVLADAICNFGDNDQALPSNQISVVLEPPAPVSQSASLITATSFTANWNTALGASEYLLDVSTDGFSSFITGYNGKIVAGTSDVVSLLSPNTTYSYRVRSANGSGQSTYSGTKSATTLEAEPTTQSSSISFTNPGETSLTVSWVNGNGNEHLLVVNQGSAVSFIPQDGSGYTGNSNFLTAADQGSGNKIVYRGNSNSVIVTGMAIGTVYHFRVYDLNGSAQGTNYLTTTATGNPNSRTTLVTAPTSQATALVFSNITTTSLDGSFTTAGNPTGYIVLRRAGASPTGVPVDGITYSAGNTIGDATVVSVGEATSFTNSGLTANTIYHFDVIAYNGSGAAINYLTTLSPLEGSHSTLASEPTSQATALIFSNVTTTSLNGSFTAATGSPSGYIVLRRPGASPTGVPVDGTTYSEDNTIGDATVVSVGTGTSFTNTNLTANTIYHFDVIAYNGSGATINYLTASPLEGSRSTMASEPTSQATALTFSNITTTSLNGSFTAAAGSPSGYIILRRQGASPTGVPVDGTTYLENNTIGDATVVSVGAATSFTNSGLTANTIYHFDVIAYNGSGATINYLTASPLEGSRSTLASEPTSQATALIFSNVTTTSLNGSFTAATGSPSGYIVLRRPGASPTGVPVDGTTYSEDNTIGDATVVSVGAGTSFTNTNLTANTIYHFDVIAYNGSGATINYLTASPLEGSRSTLAAEPAFQATALTFSNVTTTSIDGSFTASVGSPSGYIILRRQGASPTGVPVDGTTYSAGNTIGDATVVSMGAGTSFTNTNLTANTIYHFDVIAYNGSGAAINYLTTLSPLEGSHSTLASEPTFQATGLIFPNVTANSINGSFAAADGNPTGYIILRRQSASPTGVPVDGATYSPNDEIGDATVVSVGAGTSFNSLGLSANTIYHFDVIAYNGSGAAINYLTSTTPLENSHTTLANEPIDQATDLIFSNVTTSSLDGIFAAAGNPTGYIVLRRAGASPTGIPVDGTTYSAGNTIGDATVVSVGAGTSFTSTGLAANTIYHFNVIAYNGSGDAINYLTASPLKGSHSTMASEPTAQATNLIFSNITTNSINGSFTAADGNPSGYIILRRQVEAPTGTPVDRITYLPGTTIGNATVVSVGSGMSFNDEGLEVGTTYHYKVFAYNGSGQIINYLTLAPTAGNTVTLPGKPQGFKIVGEGSTTIDTEWQSVTGATQYEMDVSRNENFTDLIPGYNPQIIDGGFIGHTVEGLIPGTPYRLRIRAKNASGVSVNSDFQSRTTKGPGGENLNLAFANNPVTAPSSFEANTDQKISVLTNGRGIGTVTVYLYHRPCSSVEYTEETMTGSNGNYSIDIDPEWLDDFGMQFYVEARDRDNSIKEAETVRIKTLVKKVTDVKIPLSRFGKSAKNYHIISMPYDLPGNPRIEDLFEPIMEGKYDNSKWRMGKYDKEGDIEYDKGLSKRHLEQGQGYWFISRYEKELLFKGVTATTYKNTTLNPFELKLEKGWNQIGNPFPFKIHWDDVLEANGNPGGISKYKIFQSEPLGFAESNLLKPFEGGFVLNENDHDVTLTIPVTLKKPEGGRKAKNELSQNIDTEEWLLPLTLVQGDAANNLGGIGMHPQAGIGKDRWDDVTVPSFIQYLEANFYHPEFFWPKFSRDVVPVTDEYEWNMSIESNGHGPIELQWNAQSLINALSDLYLYDKEEGRLVDMKRHSSLVLPERNRKDLKIIYTHKGEYIPDHTMLGKAWPNPAEKEVNIPFVLSGTETNYFVEVDVYNLTGVKQKSVTVGKYNAGVHNTLWDVKDANGNNVTNGVYIVKLKVNGKYLPEFSKVIVNR